MGENEQKDLLTEIEERLYFYDFEVTAYDWLVSIKKYKGDSSVVIHNNNKLLQEWCSEHEDCVMAGFNNKGYDQYILKGIVSDFEPHELKELNDWIISGKQGWEFPYLSKYAKIPTQMDLIHDIVPRKSLKECEGNMCLPITETTVPFDIDRPWTAEETQQMIDYCRDGDVDSTMKLYELRKSYFRTKVDLLASIGKDYRFGLGNTNANTVALYLDAEAKPYDPTEEFTFPYDIDLSVIEKKVGKELFDFYESIPIMKGKDFATANEKKVMEFELFGCPTKVGAGGLHSAQLNYFELATEDRVILNADAFSFYPTDMVEKKLLSRCVTCPERFADALHQREDAKFNKNSVVPREKIPSLKLICNTAFGCAGSPYNKMYDPMQAKRTTVWGQLYLIYLLCFLSDIPTFYSIQNNTDGVMFSVDKQYMPDVERVLRTFEKETSFIMEVDHIKGVWQRDVNNYIIQMENGKVKSKGGVFSALNKALYEANSLRVVSNAVINYFLYDTPVEKTIDECDNIFDFQMVVKTGSTYQKTIHYVDGYPQVVQKVNRIYATKDERYGQLKKMKLSTEETFTVDKKDSSQETKQRRAWYFSDDLFIDREDTVANCPEHAIIDNKNKLTIDDIDKMWYYEFAKAEILKFKGAKKMSKEKVEETKNEMVEIPEEKVEEQPKTELQLNEKATTNSKKRTTKKEEVKEESVDKKEMSMVDLVNLMPAEHKLAALEFLTEHYAAVNRNRQRKEEKILFMAKKQIARRYIEESTFEVDGYNQNQKYDYVTAKQYKSLLNRACLKAGLDFSFDEISVEEGIPIKTDKMKCLRLYCACTLTDIETGYEETHHLFADATDNMDKAIYKAQTMALKSYIQTTFLRSDTSENLDVDYETPAKAQPQKPATEEQREQAVEQIATKPATDNQRTAIFNYIKEIRKNESDYGKGDSRMQQFNDKTLTSSDAAIWLIELEQKVDEMGE